MAPGEVGAEPVAGPDAPVDVPLDGAAGVGTLADVAAVGAADGAGVDVAAGGVATGGVAAVLVDVVVVAGVVVAGLTACPRASCESEKAAMATSDRARIERFMFPRSIASCG
jgi:hypothetical protein